MTKNAKNEKSEKTWKIDVLSKGRIRKKFRKWPIFVTFVFSRPVRGQIHNTRIHWEMTKNHEKCKKWQKVKKRGQNIVLSKKVVFLKNDQNLKIVPYRHCGERVQIPKWPKWPKPHFDPILGPFLGSFLDPKNDPLWACLGLNQDHFWEGVVSKGGQKWPQNGQNRHFWGFVQKIIIFGSWDHFLDPKSHFGHLGSLLVILPGLSMSDSGSKSRICKNEKRGSKTWNFKKNHCFSKSDETENRWILGLRYVAKSSKMTKNAKNAKNEKTWKRGCRSLSYPYSKFWKSRFFAFFKKCQKRDFGSKSLMESPGKGHPSDHGWPKVKSDSQTEPPPTNSKLPFWGVTHFWPKRVTFGYHLFPGIGGKYRRNGPKGVKKGSKKW